MQAIIPIILLCFAGATDPSTEGLKALDAKNYTEAVAQFRKAVDADLNDYGSRFHLALSLSLAGKDAEAIPEYRKVLELKPGLYEAELNLGIVLLGQKQPAEAVTLLKAASEKKPGQLRPKAYLAEAYFQSGQFAAAEKAFAEAVAMDPKSAVSQLGLGRTLARQKRVAEAAPYYRAAASLDPTFQDVLLELAGHYDDAKMPGEALALYEQFPGNPGAQERAGMLLMAAKRYPEAIERLQQTADKDPSTANRMALASAFRLNKEPQKAIPVLEKAAAADPSSYDVRMLYGAMLRDQKQFAPAAREFFAAAQLKPDSKSAWSELAGMMIMLEQYPQALSALDRVKALGGELPSHHFFRAIIFDKTKQYQLAMFSYQKFLELSEGKFPDEEFQSRQRLRIIAKELSRR